MCSLVEPLYILFVVTLDERYDIVNFLYKLNFFILYCYVLWKHMPKYHILRKHGSYYLGLDTYYLS